MWHDRLVGMDANGVCHYLMRLACLGYNLIEPEVLAMASSQSIAVGWKCSKEGHE